MSSAQRYYLTTAIAYPNGMPHMGHAYEAIATDFLARYRRLAGDDVFFLTGLDEHGLKIERQARKTGVSPQQFVDQMLPHYLEMLETFGISNDDFVRTTQPSHIETVRHMWRRMADAGDIYLGRYEGWYSVRDEAYYDEKELIRAEDGTQLSPQGSPVEWTIEESYFFRLSRYQDALLDWYEKNPGFIQPESRRNEMIAFVQGGLHDLSISRTSFDWGVPVPDAEGHVVYVWLDALANYLTGIGYPDPAFADWWPARVHVVGKDVVRFHAVYWPAFLMSAGMPIPETIFGHGFLLNRGEKMSKSTGNVVSPLDMAQRYGCDALRYFLLREIPFGQDGSYSHQAILMRINADLANGLGNLTQRSLSMVAKNLGGILPSPGPRTAQDDALYARLDALPGQVESEMRDFAIHRAMGLIWDQVALGDAYISAQEPWKLRKTDPERMASVLYHVAELVRRVAILAQPAMPSSCARILDLLAVPEGERSFAHLSSCLTPGRSLPPPQGIFPRWNDDETAED